MEQRTRRQFLASASLGVAAATVLVPAHASGKEARPKSKEPLPKLVHQVFFWLKDPDSSEDRAQLIAGIKTLGSIETVRAIHVGVPASTAKREVIDNSYQVSETLYFDDVEGQNAYQTHPDHQQFIDDYSHLWRKVVVYDSIAV